MAERELSTESIDELQTDREDDRYSHLHHDLEVVTADPLSREDERSEQEEHENGAGDAEIGSQGGKPGIDRLRPFQRCSFRRGRKG